MTPPSHAQLLEELPSVTHLLKTSEVLQWLTRHPRPLVTECLRRALAEVRDLLTADPAPAEPEKAAKEAELLLRAGRLLEERSQPRLGEVINATGILLHTGLGRAVLPETVVDAIVPALKGCMNLAVDRKTGARIERDELVEPLLRELTGAEAATVVNNNAAATVLVLAALAAGRDVIVSRGQLIEIGGSFRLPEVMAQSQARLVEVGATNRTHLQDYQSAITENTAALMRVHPSNYRIVGFTKEVPLSEMTRLAHERGLPVIDDLGAGALVDLRAFGLPYEPTVAQSIEEGADVVLFSGDKLVGAGQAGILVGGKRWIDRIRKHPLMRALRVDKTCLLLLERTLQLFRRPERLALDHPTYRMMSTSLEQLEARARHLVDGLSISVPQARCRLGPSEAYLGSGTLPTETLPSVQVTVELPGFSADRLAEALRLDAAAVFTRIEEDAVCLDVRTVTDAQIPAIAAAFGRLVS